MNLYLVSFDNAWQIASAPTIEAARTMPDLPEADSVFLLDSPDAKAILNARPGQFCGYATYKPAPYSIRELASTDWLLVDADNRSLARAMYKEEADLILAALLAYKP